MLYILGLSELNLAQPSILILNFLFCRLHVESSRSLYGLLWESSPSPTKKRSSCGVHVESTKTLWGRVKYTKDQTGPDFQTLHICRTVGVNTCLCS